MQPTKSDMIGFMDRMLVLLRRGWTQGANARDFDGFNTLGDPTAATCWCINGAKLEVSDVCQFDETARAVEQHLSNCCEEWNGERDIVEWNDTPGRTKAEVIEFMEHAKVSLGPP